MFGYKWVSSRVLFFCDLTVKYAVNVYSDVSLVTELWRLACYDTGNKIFKIEKFKNAFYFLIFQINVQAVFHCAKHLREMWAQAKCLL